MPPKRLIVLVNLDETALSATGLPRGAELTALPDALASAVESACGPAAVLDAVYLMKPGQRAERAVRDALERGSVHYHEYAVTARGEPCDGCERHAALPRNVVALAAYRLRRSR